METKAHDNPSGGTSEDVLAQFEVFIQPGYAFSPAPAGFLDWLMRNVWVLPLGIILFILTMNGIAYQIIDQNWIARDIGVSLVTSTGGFYKYEDEARFYLSKEGIYFFDCEVDPVTGQFVFPLSRAQIWSITGDTVVECVTKDTERTVRMFHDTYVYLLPLFAIFLGAAILYTVFTRRAPKSFYTLARTRRLIPQDVAPEKPKWIQPKGSLTYVEDLESALQSGWGKIFILLLYLPITLIVYRFAAERESIDIITSGFLPIRLGEIALIFIIPLVSGFLVGLGIWVLIVVGLFLGWLTSTFKLNIQPYHPDGCGGLKPLGDIALMNALIYLIPGVLLGLWAFRGLLSQSISAVTVLAYSIIVLLSIMALVTFLLPVARVHNEMARQRNTFQATYLEVAIARLEAVKNRLRQLVAQGHDQSEEAQELKYRLELLETLYPHGVVFRTWPFGYAALVTFALGQSLQYLPLIFSWIVGLTTRVQNGGAGP